MIWGVKAMDDDLIDTAADYQFEALPIQTVLIEPEKFDQAIEISDRVLTEARQWTTYLNALALFGFQQWLREQFTELPDSRQSSIWQPAYANAIEAVCHVTVGPFKICVITTRELDTTIQLPRAVLDLPEFTAHFYVAVRILEEQEQAEIWGYLRYDQWIQYQQTQLLTASPAWNYQVPLSWFDRDLTHLLLYLRCLEPTAIALPHVPSERLEQIARLKDEVVRKLSQHPSDALWQHLSWEQGIVVLTSPPLLEWFYQLQMGQLAPQPAEQPVAQPIHDLARSVMQASVNVGCWLQDELDAMAQQLNWVLLPPLFAPVRSTESSAILFPIIDPSTLQEIDVICKQLAREGVKIPAGARCAYNDLNLAENVLRLYAMTWPEMEEWTLLLILKLQAADPAKQSIKLYVHDQNGLLVEAALDSSTGINSIYTVVVGTQEEQFQVILALENSMLTLPPFMFHQGE